MLTISQALLELDRSKHKFNEVCFEELTYAVGLYNVPTKKDLSDKVFEYPLKTWICTDTGVGMMALFFEDTFIGITYQPFRKSDKEYFWKDAESFDLVVNHVKENLDFESFNPKTPFDFNFDLDTIGE